MPTVNYSIPEDVKLAFDKAFSGENKSAVIARLMREAVEERQRAERRAKAVEALLELRATTRALDKQELRAARRRGRP